MNKNKHAFGNDTSKLVSVKNKSLDSEGVLNPCGNIARNFFNDEYILYNVNKTNKLRIPINETGISYEIDKEKSFKRNANWESTQWIDVEDEHFIVWMHMETFQNFNKKWGRIDNDLKAGTYFVSIDNKWESQKRGVSKYFVLSPAEGLGAASFFGYAMVKAAVLMFISLLCLLCLMYTQKTKFDEEDLKWD
jgi:hypothetical protein